MICDTRDDAKRRSAAQEVGLPTRRAAWEEINRARCKLADQAGKAVLDNDREVGGVSRSGSLRMKGACGLGFHSIQKHPGF
jgi:hypothetical protein